jgi:MFS family permease
MYFRGHRMGPALLAYGGAVGGLSFALGPIIGGALTETVGWRSIFWIKLPLSLATLALVARFVPESKASGARAIDPIGQSLVFIGLAALTYAIIEGPYSGWPSPQILNLLPLASVALILFLIYEPLRIDPRVDLRCFHSVPFTSAAFLAVAAFGSFSGFLFLNVVVSNQEIIFQGRPAKLALIRH